MEFAKYLTGFSSTAGKRFLLAVASIIGAIAFSSLDGTPLDVNSASSLMQTAFESLVAFLAAHGSYSLVTGGTSGQQAIGQQATGQQATGTGQT